MERVGTKWTAEEEKSLLFQISEGVSIEEISKDHQRSVGGVKTKLHGIAHRLLTKENRSIDEVSSLVRLTPEEIEVAQKERDDRVERRKQRKAERAHPVVPQVAAVEHPKDDVLPVLIEIRDLLRRYVNRR